MLTTLIGKGAARLSSIKLLDQIKKSKHNSKLVVCLTRELL